MKAIHLAAACLALTAAPLAVQAQHIPIVHEHGCSLVVNNQGHTEVVGPIPGFSVALGPQMLSIPEIDGARVTSVVCRRSTIVPDGRDDRVPLQLGVPLTIDEIGSDRLATLDADRGAIRFTIQRGHFRNAGERDAVKARIDLFDSRMSAAR